MYYLGKRSRHHKALLIGSICLLFVAIGVGAAWAKQYFMPHTAITSAPAKSWQIAVPTATTVEHHEGPFSIKLPKDWKYIGREKDRYGAYMWENTQDNPGVQVMRLYIDNLPVDMKVNHLVPVTSQGNNLLVGDVSDNCKNFSPDPPAHASQIKAKWQDITFWCDDLSYERQVVGTGSLQGINRVSLSGPQTGTHQLFLTYTDSSNQPDYGLFTAALKTLSLK